MGKPNKKNKQRSQGQRSSSPPPTPVPPAPARPSDEDRQAVRELAEEAEIAVAEAEVVDVPAVPDEAPPGRSLDELRRDAEGARRRFEAALKAVEQRQRELDEARRKAEEARARAEADAKATAAHEAALVAREAEFDTRHEALVARELDAEQGFLALRRERLGPLDRERDAIRAALAALREAAAEERTRLDREHAARLDAQDAEWRRLSDDRAREAEASRRALDTELSAARTHTLAEARRQAEEIVTAATQEAEATRAALDAQTHELADRQRQLRAERNTLAADREVLDEDRAAFEERVARHAGAALRDAGERAQTLSDDLGRARTERDALHERVLAFEMLERRLGGRSPEELLAELERQQGEVRRLRDELAARPTEADRVRFAEVERDLTQRQGDERALRTEVVELRRRLATREIAALELETLRDQKEALQASHALLKTAHDELRAEVTSLTKKDEGRSPMAALEAIDVWATQQKVASEVHAPASLRELVDDLRARLPHAVEGRVLHYSDRDVRSFLGGMAMTPLLLLQGISGTGKTSLPKAVANALGGDHAVIEVQAGWRDRQDLLGYYNNFHRHYYASNFLQALYRAGTEVCRDRVTLIILDEINLSRVEQFFADFLSAIEQPEAERRVTLMTDPVTPAPALLVEGRHFRIPPNVWFVGTANHDETTTSFADKTYDRAHVMELPRHRGASSVAPPKPSVRPRVSCEALRRLFVEAHQTHSADAKKARSWFDEEKGIGPLLQAEFHLAWGNRLERDIERYVPAVCAAGGTVGEAVDHLLTTKLLRKLRDRHDVDPRGLERLRDHLKGSWVEKQSTPDGALELVQRELRARAGDPL